MERDKGQNEKGGMRRFEDTNLVGLFSDAPYFVFIYRKAERIIAALYLVTGLLPDSEPLKWSVRELGGELLSLTNTLKDSFTARRDETVNSINSASLEIFSLIEIARLSGLLSEMNAHILKDELLAFNSLLMENGDFASSARNLVIESSFFDEEALPAYSPRKEAWRDSGQKNTKAIKDKTGSYAPAAPKGQISGSTAGTAGGDNSREKKEKRRKIILDLIKRKESVTIRDVSSVITDWSDKTIQRELLALVAQGTLKKEGERRWSRYSFARG